jgi:polyisoprenoid-binding protein YceI
LKRTSLKTIAAVGALSSAAILTTASVIAFAPGPQTTAPRFIRMEKPAPAMAAGSYTIDPMHSLASFEIVHLGLSHIRGRFDTMSGHITADPAHLENSSVTFTAQVDSIDTNVAPRDADLKSDAFFDAAKYPTLTFQSTRIRQTHGGFIADGQLTIKGVTQSVAIPFKYYGPVVDPFGGTRMGIAADPITISRKAFGITWDHKMPDGSPQLDDTVTVLLSVEATKDKPAA